MGQASRTTKLRLDVGKRKEGGANTEKRAALATTAEVLTAARRSHIDFFLAHAEKLSEKVTYYSQEHLEWRERLIIANVCASYPGCILQSVSLPSGHGRGQCPSLVLPRRALAATQSQGATSSACGRWNVSLSRSLRLEVAGK